MSKKQPEVNPDVEVKEAPVEEQAATQDNAETALSPEEALQQALEEANAKAAEHWDKLLRSQAELENVRKRAQRDVDNARKFALEGIASELLPVHDSLELGLASLQQEDTDIQVARDGMQLIQQMLAKLMQQHGIKPIDPAGETFNPELHQAMSMQETGDHPANTVISVMQKGYTLNDRLLRPAMVVVAKAPAEASAEPEVASSTEEKPAE